MAEVKARVRRIDPDSQVIQNEWVNEFIDDLVRNEGEVITLYDYYADEYDTSYKIKSENGVLWHQQGHGLGNGEWSGSETSDMTRLIFDIYENVKPVTLDDDLFTL